MPFPDLIEKINELAQANPQGHLFASFVNRRRDCMPIRGNMPLAVDHNNDLVQGYPTLAIAGAKEELQFNVALGHENEGEVRAGLALHFGMQANPANPGRNKRRQPQVWERLNRLAGRFPPPVRSIIWNNQGPPEHTGFEDFQDFHEIPRRPAPVFYFFGRFFQPWHDEQNAIEAMALEILNYFDQLMPIWEAVYCNHSWQQFLDERQNQMLGELQPLFMEMGQIILHGPPGTSKTFIARRLCAKLIGLRPEAGTNLRHADHGAFLAAQGVRWDIVQFHPAYNYEDFVRGIQVSTDQNTGQVRYDTINRVFADLCQRAAANPEDPFVLIIDEINRANLAAVLGELIYALEYREQPVHIPYCFGRDGYSLTVPKNLYLIGTMNTADRSIGHIDYAVRRRFAFIPMPPARRQIENYPYINPSVSTAAQTLFDAVGTLFRPNGALSPEVSADDVQPGHTYFFADNCDQLLRKFVYQVVPLLREYVKDGILLGSAEIHILTESPSEPVSLTLAEPASSLMSRLKTALCSNTAPADAPPAEDVEQRADGAADHGPAETPNEGADDGQQAN